MSKEIAKTSRNQIASVFTKYEVGKRNLDIGGGKYETSTKYLKKHGVTNLVFDLYNRSDKHNSTVIEDITLNGADSITVLNVLNVIKCEKERSNLLIFIKCISEAIKYATQKEPMIIFSMYEQDDGTCQTNMKTSEYLPEIELLFPEWKVQIFGNVVVV